MPIGIYPIEKRRRLFQKGHIFLGCKHHSLETKKKMSLAKKGKPNLWLKGKKKSEEHKRKMSEARKGKHLSEEHKRKIGKALKGKRRSEETKRKLAGMKKGEKCHFWKGGITPITKLIRESLKYTEWRQQVFIRDRFTCQKCKIEGGKLNAHHKKKTFSKLVEEAKECMPLLTLYDACILYTPLWNIDNGQTLCEKCHKLVKKNGSRKT